MTGHGSNSPGHRLRSKPRGYSCLSISLAVNPILRTVRPDWLGISWQQEAGWCLFLRVATHEEQAVLWPTGRLTFLTADVPGLSHANVKLIRSFSWMVSGIWYVPCNPQTPTIGKSPARKRGILCLLKYRRWDESYTCHTQFVAQRSFFWDR